MLSSNLDHIEPGIFCKTVLKAPVNKVVLKGSKYVQAYTIEALTELKRTLKEDKNVLFIGTPCECEAARSVANGNEEKLLTVDLICHGVPSNKILNDYIK